MELILGIFIWVLKVPRSHAVMECYDSVTSWVDRDMYSFYKVISHKGEISLTCLTAYGIIADFFHTFVAQI